MDDLEAAIEALSFGLVAITALAVDRAAPGHALTFQQWRALVVIGSAPDGIRVSELAARIGASGPSASRLARRLSDRGWLVGNVDPLDGRAVRIRLSSSGARLRTTVIDHRRALIRETLGTRTEDPASTQLVAALAEDFARWI